MRGLLLVKNTKGEIKFSHYINNERDYESDINFIKEFIQREDKLIALENSLKKTEFFTAKEQSKFLEKLTKENKKAVEYYNEFLDTAIGADILNSFICSRKRKYKCFKYKHTDFLFLDILYEIDLKSKMFRYTHGGQTNRITYKDTDNGFNV